MKRKYMYSGPPTGLTINGEDLTLFKGQAVSLPDCPEVETIKALGRLALVVDATDATSKDSKATDTGRKGDK